MSLELVTQKAIRKEKIIRAAQEAAFHDQELGLLRRTNYNSTYLALDIKSDELTTFRAAYHLAFHYVDTFNDGYPMDTADRYLYCKAGPGIRRSIQEKMLIRIKDALN